MSTMPVPPPYAPTSTTPYVVSNDATILAEQVTRSSLLPTLLHRNVYEPLAEAYSIIPTLEMLENAYIKDFITSEEQYTSTCYRMIMQLKMISKTFADDPAMVSFLRTSAGLTGLSDDLENFTPELCRVFALDCPLALKRIQHGIPATIENMSAHVYSSKAQDALESTSARLVADITGNFITCMDALKLNYTTKYELHPLISELVVNLNDLLDLGSHHTHDIDGKSKLVNWLIKVNNLGPTEALDQASVDQFLGDLGEAHKGFYQSLK